MYTSKSLRDVYDMIIKWLKMQPRRGVSAAPSAEPSPGSAGNLRLACPLQPQDFHRDRLQRLVTKAAIYNIVRATPGWITPNYY